MARGGWLAGAGLILAVAGLSVTPGHGQRARPNYKLEAVAETRLLMEGSIHPNYQGLENTLRERPTTVEAWTFARGQALIIAENGNLLLLRPPKNDGQDRWFELSVELRQNALAVARHAAAQDLRKAQNAVIDLSNTCNRCHQAFRVQKPIRPFEDKPDKQ